jgi:hypothetical protein
MLVGNVVFAVFSQKLLLGALFFLFFVSKVVGFGLEIRLKLLPKDFNSVRSCCQAKSNNIRFIYFQFYLFSSLDFFPFFLPKTCIGVDKKQERVFVMTMAGNQTLPFQFRSIHLLEKSIHSLEKPILDLLQLHSCQQNHRNFYRRGRG